MIVVPAVDIREGKCVQLVGGDYAREAIRIDSPVDVSSRWAELGFLRQHIVDLDSATGRGSNLPTILEILSTGRVQFSVGGGIRSREQISVLLDAGARHVVLGTRALEDLGWLRDVAAQFPDSIVVAADVRDRKLVTRGWNATIETDLSKLLADLNPLPLGGILITAVHREGMLCGTDMNLFEEALKISRHPINASGGITTLPEMRELKALGISAAVLGMALYTGTLNPELVAKEFAQ